MIFFVIAAVLRALWRILLFRFIWDVSFHLFVQYLNLDFGMWQHTRLIVVVATILIALEAVFEVLAYIIEEA